MSIKISAKHFVKSHSHIVFKDVDGIIRAVNGLTLSVEAEGTDFKTVLQAIIADNRHILVKAGVYLVNSTIDLSGKKGLIIEGESYQWGHQLTDKGTVLRLNANVDMFKIDNTALGAPQNNPVGVIIKNLQLDGNVRGGLTSGRGIYAKNVGSLRIEHCHIHSFAGNGVHLEFCMDVRIEGNSIGGCDTSGSHTATAKTNGTWIPNNYGVYVDSGYVIWIRGNGIWHNVKSGIYVTNTLGVLENLYIDRNNIVWNDEHGIFIERKSAANKLWFIHIADNTIDEEWNHGLYAKDSIGTSNWDLNLFVLSNQFVGSNRAGAAVDTNFGIAIEGYSTTYRACGVELVGNIATDPFGRNQGSLKLTNVDGIRVTSCGFNRLPVITGTVSHTLSQIAAPAPSGGLPYYTTLPTTPPANSVVLYYDGTSYYIAAYVAGVWKKVAIT